MDHERIESVAEALSRFEPDNEYWDSAKLCLNHRDGPAIVQFYRHYEWPGYLWEFHYRLTPGCAFTLIDEGYVEPDPSAKPGEEIYRLRRL